MKRLYSFMLSMAIAICASAQFKSSVWMVPDDMYMGPQIAFNFSSVCRNMGVDREEFGPILKQWLDPNRNKKTEYENIRLMYVSSDNGRFRLGDDTHGSFNFQTDVTDPYLGTERPLNVWGGQAALDLKNNTLCFNLYLAPAAVMGLYGGEPLVKSGDQLQAIIAVEYEGKVATFDVTLNLSDSRRGNEIPLITLDKAGEKGINMKYTVGRNCVTHLNLDSIAACFGEDVRGGNLQLCVYSDAEKKTLTDRYTYDQSSALLLDDGFVEMKEPYDRRYFAFYYFPLPQEIAINPSSADAYAEGEHVTGSVFLVADGKYFELKLDVQFGDSEQEERNMAVVASAEQCGKFTRVLTVEPTDMWGGVHELTAAFSVPVIANALGVGSDELLKAITDWKNGKENADGTEMIYNLSDHASTSYTSGIGGYWMNRDGKVVSYSHVGDWGCELNVNKTMKELRFVLTQRPDVLKHGDVCSAQLGIYYKGRMAVLEIIMNVKDGGNGEQIALSSLKKVGEQVLTGAFSDPSDRLKINLDLNEIAALFNGDVVGKALKLYVMSDAENQLLTDRYSYEICPTVALNIEGTEFNDFSSHEYYMLTYSPYDNLLLISMHPEAFKGGQKSSGSVFLVSGDQYYELVMDILFGSEQDEKIHFDILATEQMDVKLMLTGDYYTYLNRQTGEYALVQSPIDWSRTVELLGTESPVLYAEQMQDGQLIYTCRYNAAPGQGFWFETEGQNAYRTSFLGTRTKIGMYYSDSSFKWYEEPFAGTKTGETYTLNLYFTNPDKDTAVKYIVNVEFVDEISNTQLCHARRLPAGMDISTGIEEIVNGKWSNSKSIYNLQGQRINGLQRGLNIVDGKKVMIK